MAAELVFLPLRVCRITISDVLVGHEVPQEVHKLFVSVKRVSLSGQLRLDICARQRMREKRARQVRCGSGHSPSLTDAAQDGVGQAGGNQRCGSRSPIRLAGCVGSRASTSLMYA